MSSRSRIAKLLALTVVTACQDTVSDARQLPPEVESYLTELTAEDGLEAQAAFRLCRETAEGFSKPEEEIDACLREQQVNLLRLQKESFEEIFPNCVLEIAQDREGFVRVPRCGGEPAPE